MFFKELDKSQMFIHSFEVGYQGVVHVKLQDGEVNSEPNNTVRAQKYRR